MKIETIKSIRDGIATTFFAIACFYSYTIYGVNKITAIITGLFMISMFLFKNDEILALNFKKKIKK